MEENKIVCETCSNENINKINIQRFIDKLDSYFKTNDLLGAKEHLEFWEKEARAINDECGLLTILNEKIGFSRRLNDKQMATLALDEAKQLLIKNDLSNTFSGATICVNIATTLEAFGRIDEALEVYDKAEKVFVERSALSTYEYASLLNNKSFSLTLLRRFDEALDCINKAITILKEDDKHDGEIGLSLISLAHLIYDKDEDVAKCEETLNEAIKYLDSDKQVHNANYAYTLTKCVPSLRYFKRDELANKYEQLANQIYGK